MYIFHHFYQVTVSQTGPVIKEIAKNPPVQDAGKTNSAKGKKGKEKEAPAPVKEKPKRKGPLDILPTTVEEWSMYDTPEEVCTHFVVIFSVRNMAPPE